MCIYPLISFLISLTLTSLCIRILPLLGFVDRGGGRHIHQGTVPRGGGIAVALAVFFTTLAHAITSPDADVAALFKLIVPAGIIVILGVVDDRVGLRSWVKLIFQILAAVLIWWWHPICHDMTIYGHVLPPYVSLPITVLWIVGVINAFNMIDGLDGLASGLAVISGVCLSIWFFSRKDPRALEMLIFVGACLGFLRWNFAPAKIFLGDTGSMFIGLFLAVAGGGTLDKTATLVSLVLPPLIIGVPIFDMVLAVWRRSVRKWLYPDAKGLMDADSDHLHHRLLRGNHSHSRSAGMMYVLGLVFAGMAALLLLFRDRSSAVAFALVLLTLLVMLRRLAVVELFDSMAFLRQTHRRKRLLLLVSQPLIDLLIVGFSAGFFDYMIRGMLEVRFIVYASLPVMVMLTAGFSYRVFWLRATMRDRGRLFLMSLIGGGISVAVLYFVHFQRAVPEDFAKGALLFVLMTGMLLLFERFMLHYIEAAWYRLFFMEYRHPGTRKVLLVGAGDRMRVCVFCYFCARRNIRMENIVGVIDDDPRLTGRRSWDVTVRGTTADLERIYDSTPFDRMLITTKKLHSETRKRIAEFCEAKHIECEEFIAEGWGVDSTPPSRVSRVRVFSEKFPWLPVDIVILAAASLLVPSPDAPSRWFGIALSVLLPLILMAATGVYRVSWLRAGINARWRLLKSSAAGGCLAQAVFAAWVWFHRGYEFFDAGWTIGVLLYLLLIISGLQFFRLLQHPAVFYMLNPRRRRPGGKMVIFGGGLFCRLYLQLRMSDPSKERPEIVGIIDDDEVIHGMFCNGIRVIGGSNDLEAVYKRYPFERILLAVNVISGPGLTRLHEFCAAHGVKLGAFTVRGKKWVGRQ